MKTWWTLVLGLLLLAGCSKNDSSPLGNWVKKSVFEGIPRASAVSFVIGDKAYVGLGYNDGSSETDATNGYVPGAFWVYDPAIDRWDSTGIAHFPGNPRVAAVAFSINGKGYVGTGYDGSNKLKDFWEYNPETNTWKQMDDLLGGARYKSVAFTIGNYGYVGTGYGANGSDLNDFYRFDPTAAAGSQWVKVQSIGGSKRQAATAFTYNGKAYVCTGINNGVLLTDIWEYDPTNDTWTSKTALNDNSSWTIIRQSASSFVLNDKGYVCLGTNSGALNDVWEYDFAKDTWDQKTNFEGAARSNAVAFVVSGKAIVATGQSSSYYLDDVWEFHPSEEYNEDD